MFEQIRSILSGFVTGPFNGQIITAILLAALALVAVAAYYITKMVLYGVEKVIMRSPTEWDDDLLNPRFMKAV